jgi:hypothetical protein
LGGCASVFTAEQAEAILDQVRELPQGPCRFESLETVRERSDVLWRDAHGVEVRATLLAVACLGRDEDVAARGAGVALLAAPATSVSCPQAFEALVRLVEQGELPSPTVLAPR